jgi:hypothetical protein
MRGKYDGLPRKQDGSRVSVPEGEATFIYIAASNFLHDCNDARHKNVVWRKGLVGVCRTEISPVFDLNAENLSLSEQKSETTLLPRFANIALSALVSFGFAFSRVDRR